MFLDFSKTFSKVLIESQIYILKLNNISGKLYNFWLYKQYKQTVVLKEQYSSRTGIISGVPQGSTSTTYQMTYCLSVVIGRRHFNFSICPQHKHLLEKN